MRRFAVLLIALLMCTGRYATAQAEEDRARMAAEQWIVLVDDGQYEQSWKEASQIFRDAITAGEWEKKARTDRTEVLGERRSRKLKDLKLATVVKGLPPGGQYLQVKYQSSYARKKVVMETVTAVLESDGTWRVAAYSWN